MYSLTLLSQAALMISSLATEAPVTSGHSDQARIYIIDDSTGEELSKEHKIKPVEMDDMLALVGSVIAVQKSVRIHHELIDEDASDNKVRSLTLMPFAGPPPPPKPDPNLPLSELKKDKAEYRKKVALWATRIREYRVKLEADAESFVKDVALAQDELTDHFLRQLEKNHGHDYRRSDVIGALGNANQALGVEGLRVLVLNSDGRHETDTRKPGTGQIVIDPGITIIWVNESGIPQQQKMYQNLPNQNLSAKNMLEAMELIKNLFSSSGKATADNKNQGLPE